MPTIKNSWYRHRILDACFRDEGRRYYFDTLLEKVNELFYNQFGVNISERTLRNDLAYMKDSQGYNAPIEKLMDGHKAYYRYADPNFSILNLPMTKKEAEQLGETISMLARFKGLPHFEWMSETLLRLEDAFNLNEIDEGIVSFSQVVNLKGLEFFDELFEHIKHKRILHVDYHQYGKSSFTRIVCPYQLRQYNNRWFLIGKETVYEKEFPISVIPLDRIDKVAVVGNFCRRKFVTSQLDEYFKDIVGVSVDGKKKKREKVIIKARYPEAYYIETKPIHSSQKLLAKNEDYEVFELDVIVNHELESILISHLHMCEILKPVSLYKKLERRIKKVIETNNFK